MKVVEIFKSIDGEGKYTGLPAIFIRLYGCNLRCKYAEGGCDTPYSWSGDNYKEMSVKEILDEVKKLEVKHITLTGGEPLIHPNVDDLLNTLLDNNYIINVETNGTVKPVIRDPNIFYTMDYKTYTSGMSDKMNFDALNSLTEFDVLKFVVGSIEDLNQSKEVLQKITSNPMVYFSPIFNKIEPKDIVEYILNNKLYDCRVQVQLHKVIWDPNERGV